VWISFVVPVAVLLATLLLQQLEAKLLRVPERVENPDHPERYPSDSLPLLTVGRLDPPPKRPAADRPVLRATA
jgi:hypothetical protein